MNQYHGFYKDDPLTIHHFDFYRLTSVREIHEIGFEDYQGDPESVSLIEWAERLENTVIEPFWRIYMSINDDDTRTIEIEYCSDISR
jgi:tRNA threonylcarbamoyladenosine biosynthesis protein TsaE